jgi:diguanylate cyclase (GGDEF)-like protein
MWMTMMWFWMAMILNLSFVYPDIWAFQILSFVSIVVSALSSFRYIYLQAISDETIQELEEIAFRDEITQLRSRAVLTRDVEDFISRQIPFHVVFCDLDNFKSVNDQYGHSVGDQYLTFFAYEIKLRLGNRGGFYRIAGDEFVCIFVDPDIKAFLDEIVALPAYLPNSNIKFLGFSHGVAYYPTDGDSIEQLLECADQRMYVMKRQQSATAPVGSSLIISHKNPKL